MIALKLNKRGTDLIMKNTVEAVLFLILAVVVIIILVNWWKAYTSQGSYPALKSLDGLQKGINALDPERISITRNVAIQTNDYFIRGYSSPDLCGESNGVPYFCVCICDTDTCDMAYNDPKRNCKLVDYDPKDMLIKSPTDGIKNYKISLIKIDEQYIASAALSG